MSTPDFNKSLYVPLASLDPEVQNIIDKEIWRQYSGLELIASENLTSRATMEANGSFLTNKCSEGLPGARYCGGNEYFDELELLCQRRALQAFHLDPTKWGVNVQPYSGCSANFAVLTALIQPQDRLMGLGLADGGHLSHGHYTAKKKITTSSMYFQSFPYGLDPSTHLIDYAALSAQAKIFKPRIFICGASAYPRDWDYKTLREIADEHDAFLMADIAHTSGLIIAEQLTDPFEYCDIVTTTTHKTLRGPRAGLVFYRKDSDKGDLGKRVNEAIFPGCQGGPHNNTIAGIATTLFQACQPPWKEYAKQVIANARTLAEELKAHGYKLQTQGTDNHIILWDLRPLGLTGSKMEKLCDIAAITITKNAVCGDKSAQVPGGIRIGTPALTSRDMREEDIKVVATFLHRAIQIALVVQEEAGNKLLKDFVRAAITEEAGRKGAIQVRELRRDVRAFARKWPVPGIDMSALQRPAGVEDD